MSRWLGLFVIAMLLHSWGYAAVTKLGPRDLQAIQDSSRFKEVRSVSTMPPAVVVLCSDSSGGIADPGQKWEATDFITDHSLPQRRLIWAATDGKRYVIHYERGGYAHSFHVLIASYSSQDGSAAVVWRGIDAALKDYGEFLTALKDGKLDDTRDYAN